MDNTTFNNIVINESSSHILQSSINDSDFKNVEEGLDNHEQYLKEHPPNQYISSLSTNTIEIILIFIVILIFGIIIILKIKSKHKNKVTSSTIQEPIINSKIHDDKSNKIIDHNYTYNTSKDFNNEE